MSGEDRFEADPPSWPTQLSRNPCNRGRGLTDAGAGQTPRASTRLRLTLVLLGVYAAVLLAAQLDALRTPGHRPCPPGGPVVLVDTKARVLCLCRDGAAEAAFRVALGRGGLDKRTEGDGKTPLGAYGLGVARSSRRYHTFIPVAYPTAQQQQSGYTGGDIGIHGPHIAFAWLRQATVWRDWTRGCIAVGTAAQIDGVAAWVHRHRVRDMLIV